MQMRLGETMSDLANSSLSFSPGFSTDLAVVCLFCALGLVLVAGILPMIAPEDMSWVLSHIE
jgi:hypothetical protein